MSERIADRDSLSEISLNPPDTTIPLSRDYLTSDLQPILRLSTPFEHIFYGQAEESGSSVPTVFAHDGPEQESIISIPLAFADDAPLLLALLSYSNSDEVAKHLSMMMPKDLVHLVRTVDFFHVSKPAPGHTSSLLSLALLACAEVVADLLCDIGSDDKLADLRKETGLTDHDEILLSEIINLFDANAFERLNWKSCLQIVKYLQFDLIASCVTPFCEKIRKVNRSSAVDMLRFVVAAEEYLHLSDIEILSVCITTVMTAENRSLQSFLLLRRLFGLVESDVFNTVVSYNGSCLLSQLINLISMLPVDEAAVNMHHAVMDLFDFVAAKTNEKFLYIKNFQDMTCFDYFFAAVTNDQNPYNLYLKGASGIHIITTLINKVNHDYVHFFHMMLVRLALVLKSQIHSTVITVGGLIASVHDVTFWFLLTIDQWIELIESIIRRMPYRTFLPYENRNVSPALLELAKVTDRTADWERLEYLYRYRPLIFPIQM